MAREDTKASSAEGDEGEHYERIARQGFSQIGIFDHVPVMGYREYWYPAVIARKVGTKPVQVKLLGEELVFFRGKRGRVVAFWDRCPHRGALLSFGRCEFEGTLSCPYHGYTFDETGTCVAALTEGPDSGLTGKLRARAFPTAEVRGIVFVWTGQTEPVPIEEDVPEEFFDPAWVVNVYVRNWPINWAVTIENNADSHNSYIHRFRIRRFFNLDNFRRIPAYWSGTRVVEEGEKHIGIMPVIHAPQQAYYPLLGEKWPQHVWWRFLSGQWRGVRTLTGKPYSNQYRLPSIIRVDLQNRLHMRWAVPLDKESCRMFSFGLYRAPGRWRRLWAGLNFHTIHRYFLIKGTNELEDLPVQRAGRLDPFAPQKLGVNDRAIIFWRRRMPWKSRDARRLWKKEERGRGIITERVVEAEELETTPGTPRG